MIDVLGELQGALNDISPLLGGLDVVLGRLDEEIFGFKLERARSEAWEAAVLLAGQTGDARDSAVRMLDRYAAGLGRVVLWRRRSPSRPRSRWSGSRSGREPPRRSLGWTSHSASDRSGYRWVMPGGPRLDRGERLPTIGEPGGVAAWPEN